MLEKSQTEEIANLIGEIVLRTESISSIESVANALITADEDSNANLLIRRAMYTKDTEAVKMMADYVNETYTEFNSSTTRDFRQQTKLAEVLGATSKVRDGDIMKKVVEVAVKKD